MSQRIEVACDPLVQHLRIAQGGVVRLGAALKIKQNDAASFQLVLDRLMGIPAGPSNNPPAVPGAKQLWDEGQVTKSTKTGLYRLECSHGRALAGAAVDLLKPLFGKHYTLAWKVTGITGNSLAIPTDPSQVLGGLGVYFSKHPEQEAPNQKPLPITAAACQAAAAAILAAAEASKQSNVDAANAQIEFEAAKQAGRDRLMALREELSHLIPDDSPLWYAFGFDRPIDSDEPTIVQNLAVEKGVPGSRSLYPHWDDSRRAFVGYRATVFDAATGEKVAEQLVPDTHAQFTDLPANTTVKIIVTARGHDGKESAPCEPFTIAVP